MAFFYSSDFFEEHKQKYDYVSKNDFAIIMQSMRALPTHGILLDLACGSGIIGEKFQESFPTLTVIGTDICFPLLKWSHIHKCQSDACCLPFKNDSLDCIIAAAAFHHFPSIEAAVRECSRCLKPGGIFLAYDPNMLHPQRLFMMTDPLRHFFYRNGDHAISSLHFKTILVREGFDKIKIKYVTFEGKDPGILARFNNKVNIRLGLSKFQWLKPFVCPWFIVTATRC